MEQSRSGWIERSFVVAAAFYVLAGVGCAIVLSVRVPFADAWRHYTRLLGAPFPTSVLAADNGHPELFANLIRWASLSWFGGSEGLQTGVGVLLALATLFVLLRIVQRTTDASMRVRAAATFALSLGLFWLGNARALLHANEALHVYSVLLCTAGALSLLLRAGSSAGIGRIAAATVLCIGASFCFGSGIASFAALCALLFVQRASLRHFAIPVTGALLTLVLYRCLPGSIAPEIALQPVAQASLALRWLATPLIYLFWPLLDPQAASALPHPFDAIASIAADAWTNLFGDVRISIWPQPIAGIALLAILVHWTVQARRRGEQANDIERLGLVLAWFGVAVAGLIAATRVRYFAEFPLQLHVPRYLPWSTLAWTGLLVAFLARTPMRTHKLVLAAAIGLFALAAEGGMTLVMIHQREDADDAALAAVVGVWPDESTHSENDPRDVRAGAIALRAATVGPFAWPEAALIGKSVPTDARAVAAQWIRRDTRAPSGLQLQARITQLPCDAQHLLVVDGDRVAGLLRHTGKDLWRGVAIDVGADAVLGVSEIECARGTAR